MKYIQKDEMYNWMGASSREIADAQIPDELHQKLADAIAHYNNVCKMIYDYLEDHPDDEFKI